MRSFTAHMLALGFALGFGACGETPDLTRLQETPIKIRSEKPGSGPKLAEAGSIVNISYRLSLPDGKVLLEDKSFRFQVGTGAVIRGLDDTVLNMRKGGEREVSCPPQRHWGRRGYADVVPPNTDVIIFVRVNDIES